MRVTANYLPARGSGEDLNSDDVMAKLEAMNVRVGVKDDVVRTICLSENPMRNIIIAEGIPPSMGEKARIETYFELNERRHAAEKDDGSMDFRDLGEISSAREGQELYRKIPPTVGEPGKDIHGNSIPGLLGRDLKLVLGPGTVFAQNDENLVLAEADGEILVNNGIITISSIHKVDGDVDYSTGNLKFNGTIKINGSVKAGFKIEAEGDIEIQGNVEDAEIYSGNDVIINGGFSGTGEGKISAGRDVILKFIENQSVEAGRDIIISGPSYHATLQAGNTIMSKGPKSVIVGGNSEAKNKIEANKIGSDAGASTVLKVGVDPKLAQKMNDISDEIQQTQESLDKVQKTVVFLYKTKIDNNNTLPPDKLKLLEKLEQTKDSLPKKIEQLEEKRSSLLQEQKELDEATVTANLAVYSKVKVYFGQQFMALDDKMGPSVFRMFKGDIIRSSI